MSKMSGWQRADFLAGPDGRISNTKLFGWVVLAASFWLGMRGLLTPNTWAWLATVLVGASFGAKVFLAVVQRGTFTNTTTEAVTADLTQIAKDIAARRGEHNAEATP